MGVIGNQELFNCGVEMVESKFVLMGGGGCNILKFMSGEVQVQKKIKKQQIGGGKNSFE